MLRVVFSGDAVGYTGRMSMQYEVEVKALLGSEQKTNALLAALKTADSAFAQFDEQKQLNHYFKGGSMARLIDAAASYFKREQLTVLRRIEQETTSFSVRSREKNGASHLVVKGSLDDTSADHSHRRIEFEEELDLSIEGLDELILTAGFRLEAKWSAERRMFRFRNMTIDVMFSPGYGYVVEFEKVIHDDQGIEAAREEILSVMHEFDIEELDPERLSRMFAYYNAHWSDYYGTRKIFTVT